MKTHWSLNSGFAGFLTSSRRVLTFLYKEVQVGTYIPDLIAFEQIVMDTKTIDKIGDHERGQILNYLKITRVRVGVILNFKHRRLEWERLVL